MKWYSLVGALFAALVFQTSCHRTVYVNLRPPGAVSTASDQGHQYHRGESGSGWQHFFMWGWFPITKVIDGEKVCGGPNRVLEIRTQRTFLEGLVGALAGYYVNIYNPYDGRVVCIDEPVR
jgi:hypothetical protein